MKARSILPPAALDLIAARFRLLGDASRLRLLNVLRERERSVNELVEATGLTQSNVSRHLQLLTDGGLLTRRKDGLSVIYSVGDASIFELCDVVCGSVQKRLTAAAAAVRGW